MQIRIPKSGGEFQVLARSSLDVLKLPVNSDKRPIEKPSFVGNGIG